MNDHDFPQDLLFVYDHVCDQDLLKINDQDLLKRTDQDLLKVND